MEATALRSPLCPEGEAHVVSFVPVPGRFAARWVCFTCPHVVEIHTQLRTRLGPVDRITLHEECRTELLNDARAAFIHGSESVPVLSVWDIASPRVP